jgi:hypothetical protein
MKRFALVAILALALGSQADAHLIRRAASVYGGYSPYSSYYTPSYSTSGSYYAPAYSNYYYSPGVVTSGYYTTPYYSNYVTPSSYYWSPSTHTGYYTPGYSAYYGYGGRRGWRW